MRLRTAPLTSLTLASAVGGLVLCLACRSSSEQAPKTSATAAYAERDTGAPRGERAATSHHGPADATQKELAEDLGAVGLSLSKAPTGQAPVASAPPAPPGTPIPLEAKVKRAPLAAAKADAAGAAAQLHGVADQEIAAEPKQEVTAEFNTEAYDHVEENRFLSVTTSPLSTFSVDVDTASYSNVRRFLGERQQPPAGSVRIEELVNYFSYEYPSPKADQPFSVYTEVGPAPWAQQHKLVHIGLQGKRIAERDMPPRNLVFLIDVSGSMSDANKLPLLQRSFKALLGTLGERDRVAMVVYAGASGVVLPPTSAANEAVIVEALDRLQAGGSTNGASGIELAYQLAQESASPGSANRVILATDGDFNVGTTSESELVKLIEKKREAGVFLTVLGFGMGNYKDSTLEKLADKGNGNYAYIDSYQEAQKVLVEEAGANLVTIAKDVKIQVEFNPEQVGAYRLIGYENRHLNAEDFEDDRKDAGEIGAGHSVTALYEILTPEQAAKELPSTKLKYQRPARGAGSATELATVKLRYKEPTASQSQLLSVPINASTKELGATSDAFRFSAAVAGFGMVLRSSEHRGVANLALVQELAEHSVGADEGSHRRGFLRLVQQARAL